MTTSKGSLPNSLSSQTGSAWRTLLNKARELRDMDVDCGLAEGDARRRAVVAIEEELVSVNEKRANIIKTPPEISCAVHTDKFVGRLTVIYDRAMDCYVVELRDGSNIICQKETIFVDELAQTIENLIDDGKWRDIKIEVLKPARSTHVAA